MFEAGPAGGTGVLAAAVGLHNQTGRQLAQRQGLFHGVEHELGGHLDGQVSAHDLARTGIEVAPAPADQRQVRDVAYPHLVGDGGACPKSQFSATAAAKNRLWWYAASAGG